MTPMKENDPMAVNLPDLIARLDLSPIVDGLAAAVRASRQATDAIAWHSRTEAAPMQVRRCAVHPLHRTRRTGGPR